MLAIIKISRKQAKEAVQQGLLAMDQAKYQKAATLFSQAFENGNAWGCFNYGVMHLGQGLKPALMRFYCFEKRLVILD